MRGRHARGMSPLVATVVLISATVVGGLLVYNYFQQSVDTVAATSATLALTVRSDYLTASTRLVYIEAVNFYDLPVNVTGVWIVGSDGSHFKLPASSVKGVPAVIEPGEKASIIATVPANAAAVYLEYTVGDQRLMTQPEDIRLPPARPGPPAHAGVHRAA